MRPKQKRMKRETIFAYYGSRYLKRIVVVLVNKDEAESFLCGVQYENNGYNKNGEFGTKMMKETMPLFITTSRG
jgi:hypothetical protein